MMCTKHMIIIDEHRILFHLIVGTASIILDFQFFSSYIGWFSESTLAWSHLIQHPPNLNPWFNSPTVLECHSPGCSPKYTPCKYTENYRTLESESQKVLFFEMTNPLQTINLWFFVSFLSGVIRCIADPHSTSNSRKATDARGGCAGHRNARDSYRAGSGDSGLQEFRISVIVTCDPFSHTVKLKWRNIKYIHTYISIYDLYMYIFSD